MKIDPTKRFIERIGEMQYNMVMRKEVAWRMGYAADAVCEMTGCTASGPYPQLVFDHCHRHGWVRGMLCNSCNVKVGRIESVMLIEGIVMNVSGTSYASFLANCPDCRDDVLGVPSTEGTAVGALSEEGEQCPSINSTPLTA